MMNLFFDKNRNMYFYNDITKICHQCMREIADISNTIFICNLWSKKQHDILYYCRVCALRKKEEVWVYIYKDLLPATLTDKIPMSCVPVLNIPPSLSYSRVDDIFSLAITNREGEKIVNKTKLALKQSFEGAQIGKEDILEICEQKDKELSTKKGFNYLNMISNSEAILPETEKKKEIEHKEG